MVITNQISSEITNRGSQHEHESSSNRRQRGKKLLHHYENILTLESVRLKHGGLYTCVPSSGLQNATVNLHVVKGLYTILSTHTKNKSPKGRVTNDILWGTNTPHLTDKLRGPHLFRDSYKMLILSGCWIAFSKLAQNRNG